MDIQCCCVTGHRKISREKLESLRAPLAAAIRAAYDRGCRHFVSGYAEGADLLFAQLVVELRQEDPTVRLEAAIPHSDRLKSRDKEFQRLLKESDERQVFAQGYDVSSYQKRNEYMVDKSQLVIALYDGGHSGGTYNTVRYARRLGRELQVLW